MGRQAKEQWAKELGSWLLRGESEAARSRFLSLVLVTHAEAATRLSAVWPQAGFGSSLEMSADMPNAVLVPVLDLEEARAVMSRYLAYFRLLTAPGGYHPFTEEAVDALVVSYDYHPRAFLTRAHDLIERALAEPDRTILDAAFVRAGLTTTRPEPKPEFDFDAGAL